MVRLCDPKRMNLNEWCRFGKQCEQRIIRWIAQNQPRSSTIVELGCGNGHLLAKKERFSSLFGLDYSTHAIKLAEEYAEAQGCTEITFFQCDILADEPKLPVGSLVVDKGTFDAISLGPDPEAGSKEANSQKITRLCARFKTTLNRILGSANGRFLITSCNWTRDELVVLFAPEYVPFDEIDHPVFVYGGRSGQTVTSLALRKTDSS